jgi:cobalt-zinc-cadmium efflux system outer membrane protein
LVSCVQRASLARRAGAASLAAADARIAAADPWFSSSPTLALTGSRRDSGEGSALNWSASLGVELDLAGQRGSRRRAAVAERDAAAGSVVVSSRAQAALAWHAYFDVLAATEAARTLERLEATAQRVWDTARAAAERGVAPGMEADLAEATLVRISARRVAARRAATRARGELASMLGLSDEGRLELEGALEPLVEAERSSVTPVRVGPTTPMLEAEARAHSARADELRRRRVPSPTLSVIVAREGFDENVLGVGLAFPLPLPEPLGRMHSGEIAESEALAEQARLLAADSRRKARAEWSARVADYRAAGESVRLQSEERARRAEAALAGLAREVEAGRLSTKEAVLLQEPLFELLLGALAAREALCHASVDLVQAAGRQVDTGGAR